MPELVKRIVRYRCVICGEEYAKKSAAEECAARGFKPTAKVGDLVVTGHMMGWIDGSEAWVHEKTKSKRATKTGFSYTLIYIVTFIDGDERDGHRVRYHLRSLAMKDGEGYGLGYTYDEGHYSMTTRLTGKKAAALKAVATKLGWLGVSTDILL